MIKIFANLCVVIFIIIHLSSSEIYDPVNIFCGSSSCYDILGVQRTADLKSIKKAYRKLSLTEHPDKSKATNATEVFRKISKAYEVLMGNESKALFDYYLDHPRDYFKVSGHHYMKNLPKSDVRLVITLVLLLISWFFHTIQYQKYEKAIKFLKNAITNSLNLKNGGTKQTMDLLKRATDIYNDKIKQLKSSGDKSAGKIKMQKDPIFLQVVEEIVAGVKIEGGYKKPEWRDLIIVRVVMLPYATVQWAQTYHRRYLSKQPIPLEDKVEMSREKVGLATWEEMDETIRHKLIEREIWKSDVYAAWVEEKQVEELKKNSKGGKHSKKRQQVEKEAAEYDEYMIEE